MSVFSKLGKLAGSGIARSSLLTRIVIHTALHPKILTRFAHDARLLTAILDSPGGAVFLQRVIADARFFNIVLDSPGGAAFLQRVIADARFFNVVLDSPGGAAFLQRVLADARFFNVVLDSPGGAAFLQRVLADARFFNIVLDSPGGAAFLQRVLADARFLELIFGGEKGAAFLQSLLSGRRFLDRILAGENGAILIPRLCTCVASRKDLWLPLFEAALAADKCASWLKAEPGLWQKYIGPLQEPALYAKLLDTPFFQRLFSLEYLPRLLTAQGDSMQAFAGFASHNAVLRRLAAMPEWISAAASVPSVTEGILAEDAVLGRTELALHAELKAEWDKLLPVFDSTIAGLAPKRALAHRSMKSRRQLRDLILDVFCDQDVVRLAHGRMRFPDRQSLWVLLHELLVDETYYFTCSTETPYIIDAGAHFGLATYYFKTLYPGARVRAFEPVPELQRLLQENIDSNGFTDVAVVPHALSDVDGQTSFFVSEKDSMAGSLTERRRVSGDAVHEVSVRCCRLSEFLDEEVHFLKLDIEGSEDKVIREAGTSLSRVHNICIEYHEGHGLSSDRLNSILTILHDTGFEVLIAPAMSFQRLMAYRPLEWIGRPYSAMIWGANKRPRA